MKRDHHWTLCSPLAVFFVLSILHPVPAGAVPPVSFAPSAVFVTGASPRDVAIGDLNGDGKPDLATANWYDNTVSVLLGDGIGGFGPKTDLGVGAYPVGTAIADLNADGKPDLAVTNVYGNTVSVLLGHGDGTFGLRTDFPTGIGPYTVRVADMNGDGRLDLVVPNDIDGTVSQLLGDGAGGFTTGSCFSNGCEHVSVAIGDLNRDGAPDFAVPNYGCNTLSVLIGDGTGGYGPSTEFPTGDHSWAIATADLNADGMLDLVVTNFNDHTISVLLGDGAGSFGAKTDFATGLNPWSIALGDLNCDGKPDLAVGNGSAAAVSVLLGNGDGTFSPRTDVTISNSAWGVAIGDLNSDGKPDLVATIVLDNLVSVLLNTTTGTTIAPQAPTTCVTPSHACVEVPVTITRVDAAPLRGYSVTLQLSGNLALCPPEIVEGSYLKSVAATSFQTINNGGGSYTVDCAILGLPCGATAPSGTLFTLNLGSAAPSGTGTVTVTGVSLRDCSNGPLDALPGPPASLTIDNQVPAAVVLAAAQRMAGNDPDGTTKIDLSWTGTVTVGDSVLIYRAPYGHYPEYDMGGAVPATPGYPPGLPWAPAGHVLGPGASFTDETTARDFWYYVAFVKDPCGNVSGVSNRTGGTLNYFLGDVSDGVTLCQGNNLVFDEDISFLGAHYGALLADPDALGCLDVGPTTDHSVNARPLTDDRLNFEDLMLFAINYNQVSAPQARALPVSAGRDELSLEAPARVSAGEPFPVTLQLKGAGILQGISTQLGWDPAVAEPLSVEAGALVTSQGGVVLSSGPGNVDAALLGPGRTLVGDGALATVMFRARASGDPKLVIERTDARDAANRTVALTGIQPQAPTKTAFAPATPNPFARSTTLSFSLGHGGPVELAIFSVDGRRVRTLVKENREAGVYRLNWDGADEAGRAVSAGLFYVRLLTPQGRFNRTLVMVK